MGRLNLLLVSPPSQGSYGIVEKAHEYRMPLGLAYISAYVEQKVYRVKALDFDASGLLIKDFEPILDELNPEIVGFTCTTPLVSNVVKMAEITKQHDHGTMVIAGGPHATALPKETLKRSKIDLVVRGEGEKTTLEILECLRGQRNTNDLLGISYKKDGVVVHNPDRTLIKEIDRLPEPARHHFPMDRYQAPYYLNRSGATCANLIGSRGCPYRCIFCGQEIIFKHTVRSRCAESIVDELEGMIKSYGIGTFFFEDSTFVLDSRRVEKTCREILSRNLEIAWGAMGRVDRADRQLYDLMKRAGCIFIFYGVESGNQDILDRMRKNTSLDQIHRAVNIAKASRIPLNTSFILGLPGETRETIRETIAFAIALDPDYATFSLAVPYPGTEFYRIAVKEGYDLTDWDRYQESRYAEPIYIPEGMNREELVRYHKLAYRKFYYRPGYIIKSIRNVNNPKDLVHKIKIALSLWS